ncbi:hypothetical protein [Streptomyces ardesiacus]|uniref:hypothetical protein n=1 Tax=Streptomyces ardesiacus TaxID=285564 RepID=UPI0036E8F8CC
MRGYTSLLTRVVGHFDCPVWAVETDDVDEMLHALAVAGLAAGTRRQYLQMLRTFHAFVAERYAVQVRALFGVPVGGGGLDRFNRVRQCWRAWTGLSPGTWPMSGRCSPPARRCSATTRAGH